MPTGYTYYIENGDITTGKEFLKKCIRAFGCCMDQREDPLSAPLITEIKPDTYYKEQYKRSVKKLKEFKEKSIEEIEKELEVEKIKTKNRNKERLYEMQSLREKYLKVREEVEKWTPPTPEHEGIKVFALEQIDMCMPDLSVINDYEEECDEKENIEEYISDVKRLLEEDIEHYKKKMIEEEQRAASRTKFIKDFLDSLEG